MRRRVSSLTTPLPVSARETVATETPAARATSLMVVLTAPRRADWKRFPNPAERFTVRARACQGAGDGGTATQDRSAPDLEAHTAKPHQCAMRHRVGFRRYDLAVTGLSWPVGSSTAARSVAARCLRARSRTP